MSLMSILLYLYCRVQISLLPGGKQVIWERYVDIQYSKATVSWQVYGTGNSVEKSKAYPGMRVRGTMDIDQHFSTWQF